MIRVRRFLTAAMRWERAGRPTRSDAEVERIYLEHCALCAWLRGHRCRHPRCGCQVRTPMAERQAGGPLAAWLPRALLNKLRMATESCPIGKWQASARSSTPDREDVTHAG